MKKFLVSEIASSLAVIIITMFIYMMIEPECVEILSKDNPLPSRDHTIIAGAIIVVLSLFAVGFEMKAGSSALIGAAGASFAGIASSAYPAIVITFFVGLFVGPDIESKNKGMVIPMHLLYVIFVVINFGIVYFTPEIAWDLSHNQIESSEILKHLEFLFK